MDDGEQYAGRSVPPPGFQPAWPPDGAAPPTWPPGAPTTSTLTPSAQRAPGRPQKNRPVAVWIAVVAAVAIVAALLIFVVLPGSGAAGVAKSINLTSADLPGWTDAGAQGAGTHVSITGGSASGKEMISCLGSAAEDLESSDAGVADAGSDLFALGEGTALQQVASNVEVQPDQLAVREDLETTRALLNNPSALSCFGAYLDKEVVSTSTGASVSMSNISLTAATPPPTSATNAVGLQMSLQISDGAESVPLVFDDYDYAVGRYEISLMTWGVDSAVGASVAGPLATLLVNRAETKG